MARATGKFEIAWLEFRDRLEGDIDNYVETVGKDKALDSEVADLAARVLSEECGDQGWLYEAMHYVTTGHALEYFNSQVEWKDKSHKDLDTGTLPV